MKICGCTELAHKVLIDALKLAEETGRTKTLTYPAFRSSWFTAAQCASDSDFAWIRGLAKKACESGYLSPHDLGHVYQGGAESDAQRFAKTGNKLHGANAKKNYEEACHYTGMAEKHSGGLHPENTLRLKITPVVLAQAGIYDLVDVGGMNPDSQVEALSCELEEQAIYWSNPRVADRMKQVRLNLQGEK